MSTDALARTLSGATGEAAAAGLRIGGVPEGHDARVVGDLARQASPGAIIHVCLDDARLSRFSEHLAFFAPDVSLIRFPAWDCLPYDRVSPNPAVVADRTRALTALAGWSSDGGPLVVGTTVNAVLQRTVPVDVFADGARQFSRGETFDIEALQGYLAQHGFSRVQTVREPGEFAVRGGIVDLFAPGTEEPYRIDLFGDEIEDIRVFDALSQRTTGHVQTLVLAPMSEVTLDAPSIARFRTGYRELFGAVTGNDPLYAAVSEGRRTAGMEHWLPLFYGRMTTLFDHFPIDVRLVVDPQARPAVQARLAQIHEFYEARQSLTGAAARGQAAPYKPLPPDRLYLTSEEWGKFEKNHNLVELSSHAVSDVGGSGLDAGGRPGRDFAEARTNPDVDLYQEVASHTLELAGRTGRALIAAYSAGARDRLSGLLSDHGDLVLTPVDTWQDAQDCRGSAIPAAVLPLESGFVSGDLAVITEQDILGDRLTRPRKRRRPENFLSEVSSLHLGDLVVHVDHGIGRYEGIETLTVSGAPHDCLRLVYADGDKLFVPAENIEVLSRFGGDEATAALDKLGGAGWQNRKARVKKRLKDMADDLLRVAAEREVRRTEPVQLDSGLLDSFTARFPYAETDDQMRSIDEVLADLQVGRPMDRLICGDVGFGKTEVALRAAFAVASGGGQVAVVVPTTLLARQHYRTAVDRFRGFPVRVAQLSRMVGQKEAKAVRQGLADGSIDVVVGTHALLAASVSFANLSLVVVDEEQHFGVKQKERLKQLRENIHVLTMTATPIPRTLQLALTGVRELSLIATPPVDRLAVRTFVLPFDPVVVREALMREHFRGGQTYYVCPRIEHLDEVAEQLRELAPEVKVVTAHGRMPPSQLEDVMTAFYDGQFDVLLCTSIVESGLDVPAANTIVLHRADMFGLAQLYQLRGRIGRSKLRGYAYLTYPPNQVLGATAQQRLQVLETLDTLGAGFSLASHDLDIRGAGNLLGEEQSGHIREVGVELYQQLLEEAVTLARAGRGVGGDSAETQRVAESWTPAINVGVPVLIPETYVADLQVRLDVYRRLSRLSDAGEIDGYAAELIDRFGPLPDEVKNLMSMIQLKHLCRRASVDRVDAGPKGAVVAFRGNAFPRPDKLVVFISQNQRTMRLRPDHRLVYTRSWETADKRVAGVGKLLTSLAKLAA